MERKLLKNIFLFNTHVGLISTRIAMIKTFCADAGRKYINAGRLLLTRRETGIEVCEVKRTNGCAMVF